MKTFEEFLNENLVNQFENIPQPGEIVDTAYVNVYGQATVVFKTGKTIKFQTQENPPTSDKLSTFISGWTPVDVPSKSDL